MKAPAFRMFAIDLDGTLLGPDGKVSPRTQNAIAGAVAAGFKVCFATGRSLRESIPILESVGHLDHAVFVTGAVVVDMGERKTLHRQLMPPALARELCAFLEERGHGALALQDFDQTGIDYLASNGRELHDSTNLWIAMTESKVQLRSDLAQHDHALTLRVSIVAGADEVERCHDELKTHFGSRVFCHNLVVQSCKIAVLEVFDPGVDKWQGVLRVAKRHQIAPDQIIAIGDDVNDLAMITQAGLGVAMGNARPHVQAAAKRVIGSNRQDGLAVFLEECVAAGLGQT